MDDVLFEIKTVLLSERLALWNIIREGYMFNKNQSN